MKKQTNTIILSIAFLLGLILTVSALQAMSVFRTRAQAPIPGTVIVPQTPAPKPTQNSLQLQTFPFITLTPTPSLTPTPEPTPVEEEVPEITKKPTDPQQGGPGTDGSSDPGVPGLGGLIFPSKMTPHPSRAGMFQLPFPRSPDGSYRSYTCAGRSWGSKETIGVLNTVSIKWKQRYPGGWLNIGDINAAGHKSHNWGRATDLDATTNGRDLAADFTKGNYNRPATIELGKMFVDTDYVLNIWYNDPAVNNAVLAYSRSSGKSRGMNMKPIPGHDNHFHLDVKQNPPKLPFWTPGC